MTTSPASNDWPALQGRREAEHLSVFDGDDTLGENALTLARRIGNVPMPWQVDNLLAILRTDADGGWTHPSCCIICPRQNGKSEILLLRCLYGLFVRRENIVFSTQQWKTARKLAIRMREMVKARPDLRRRLASPPTLSQGQSIFTTTDGCELMFCTRSGDTGKGLDKVDLVIYDEAYNLTEAEMTGPTLAQMAAPHPQTIYTSTAVDASVHQFGQVLAGLRRSGHRKTDGLYFAEYMAPEPGDDVSEAQRRRMQADPAIAKLANPSYGVIQTDAKVSKVLLDLGGTAIGRRLFEADVFGWGDWPADADSVVSEIPAQKWADMLADDGPLRLRGAPAVAVHRDADSGKWVVAAAHYTDSGRAHLEIGYNRKAASPDVVKAVVELVAAWNPVAVAIKRRGDAAALEDELLKAGIEPEMVDGGRWAQWCGGFLNAAMSGRLSHSGQDDLNDAAGSAVRHDMPAGGFIWDEAAAGASGAALVAATLAHGALLAFGTIVKKMPARPVTVSRTATDVPELDVMRMAF